MRIGWMVTSLRQRYRQNKQITVGRFVWKSCLKQPRLKFSFGVYKP
jgi:hypothetical protein